jgi:putative ABC transport system ATP-binding protein
MQRSWRISQRTTFGDFIASGLVTSGEVMNRRPKSDSNDSAPGALFVDALVAGYAGEPVARLDSLQIDDGQSALLLGPSGSGKTTLLLAMAGLAERIAGEVLVAGVAPHSLGRQALDRFRGRTIGFVFQNVHLVSGLTLLQNVLLAAFASGAPQDPARARELMERLGVGASAGERAERLSRGQAQRAAIARALLLRPRLILADEPTASLDDAACEGVAQVLLSSAREEGAALLIATHDHRLRRHFSGVISVGTVA